MKYKAFPLVLLMSAILPTLASAQKDDFPVLEGPYLGQKPPGVNPEIFAPGIISVDENFEHSAAVFSPDGTEVFWCTNVDMYSENRRQGMLRLYYMKIVDGKWTAPRPAPFVKDKCVERPVFSPDGNRLYIEFSVDQVNPDNNDIFFVEREGDGWSEPKPVSPLINSPAWERLHCITTDGSLYFSRNPALNSEEIFVSRLVEGEYTEPEILNERFNTQDADLAIIFGPNEESLLTGQLNSDRSRCGVNISYRNADDTWTDRIKTPYDCGGFLSLSPDGKYLFFLGDGIFWVSTSFIETLKPKQGFTD